jgi:hypothetical protein
MGEDDYDLLDRGCTCHTSHPPCSFCTELGEDEIEVYHDGGAEAVRDRRIALENGETWPPPSPYADNPDYGRF